MRPGNVVYLAGYTPTNGSSAVVLDEGGHVLVTDQPWDVDVLATRMAGQDGRVVGSSRLAASVPGELAADVSRVGVAGWELLTADLLIALRESFPGAELVDGGELLDRQRAIKSPAEVALIRAACDATSAGAAAFVEGATAGVRERDLAIEVETAMRRAGSSGLAFPLIVGAGTSQTATGVPQPGDRVLADGDLVLLDCGAIVEGYCGDMARTVVVGSLGDDQAHLLETTYELYEQCITALRPGLNLGELHTNAVALARSRGYELPFLLGHGIGCQNWEPPPIDGTPGTVLEEDMVITIEPGIYVPGVGGARLENTFAVTATGAEALTSGPIDVWRR